MPDYVEALKKEIALTPKWRQEDSIETIYLGGGTPSLLSKEMLQEILNEVQLHFKTSPDVEICLEANPDDISETSLSHWKALGINRLSVGIQSFDASELKWMNRAHTAGESLQCLQFIKAAGFDNFSIDLIYGSNLQSHEILLKNLATVFEMQVPHISAYALTVEPGTTLHHQIQKKLQPNTNADHQATQFEILMSEMEKAGYEQYEISNFSKPGFRSRHNSSYWQGKPYYGFGASAHAYDGDKIRRWNIANNSLYIQSLQQGTLPFEEERLTSTQQLNEYIMISLRTVEGLDTDGVSLKFGTQKTAELKRKSEKFISNGLLQFRGEKIVLTNRGKFLADGIASDLFF